MPWAPPEPGFPTCSFLTLRLVAKPGIAPLPVRFRLFQLEQSTKWAERISRELKPGLVFIKNPVCNGIALARILEQRQMGSEKAQKKKIEQYIVILRVPIRSLHRAGGSQCEAASSLARGHEQCVSSVLLAAPVEMLWAQAPAAGDGGGGESLGG